MTISCNHPRPLLDLPGYTPPRLAWSPPAFLSPNGEDQRRQLLEALRGIYAELQKVASRRALVPLLDATMQLREGQIVAGVADGQVLVMPQAVEDGSVGVITVLLDAVKNPVTVVNPDGSTRVLSEPGLYDFGVQPSGGGVAWLPVPGAAGGLRALSAGTTQATSGTVAWSNSNGLSFGVNGQTITGSMDAFRSVKLVTMAGSLSNSLSNLTVTSVSGSELNLVVGTETGISNQNVEWRASGRSLFAVARPTVMVGTNNHPVPNINFTQGNGVTFGFSTLTLVGFGLVGFVSASVNPDLGMLSHVGGNSVLSATRLAFSNANNVSFGLSTGAGAGTVTASVTVAATRDIGIVSHIGGNAVSSVSQLAFSNASNVTFSLSTAANAATLLASVAAAGAGNVTFSAGAASAGLASLVFSNSNNFSWGLNGSTITAQPFFNVTGANGSSVNATVLAFTTGVNNVGFAVSTNASGATVRAAASVNVSAGTGTAAASQVSFADANGVSFILTNGGSTVQASYARELGLVSHVGGNSVSSVTRLAFSNASNVTFSLSTAANAATVIASVGAGGGGGVAVNANSDSTGGQSELSSGTVRFGRGDAGLTAAFQSVNVNNVAFSWNTDPASTSVMQGFAAFRATANLNATATNGFVVSKFQLSNSNGVTFGVSTTSNADGREAVFTASVSQATVPFIENFGDQTTFLDVWAQTQGYCVAVNRLRPMPGPMTMDTCEFLVANVISFSNTTNSGSFAATLRGGLYTLANSTQLSLVNSFSSTFSNNTVATSVVTGSRLSSYQGAKFYQVLTSNWSSSPVLSAGVAYWLYIHGSSAGLAVFGGMAHFIQQPTQPGGIFGDTNSASRMRAFPFEGRATIASIPNSLAGSQLTASSGNQIRVPLFRIRQGVLV